MICNLIFSTGNNSKSLGTDDLFVGEGGGKTLNSDLPRTIPGNNDSFSTNLRESESVCMITFTNSDNWHVCI